MSTATSGLKVGMIVDHPNKPDWGPGKVVYLGGGMAHVFFREQLSRQAKVLMTNLAKLTEADEQHDPVLDMLPEAAEHGGYWLLPGSYQRTMKSVLPKKT